MLLGVLFWISFCKNLLYTMFIGVKKIKDFSLTYYFYTIVRAWDKSITRIEAKTNSEHILEQHNQYYMFV